MPSDPDLIGTSESCRILDIHPATLGRWVNDGTIAAAHKLPGRNGAYLFRRRDIENLAAARAQTSA